jgi:hypothetical protein
MSFTRAALWMSSGVMVWALHFGALYGLTALACARGWTGLVAPSIAAATALALLAMVPLLVAGVRRRAQFEYWLTAWIAAFGLVGIVWEALTVLLVPICR